MPKLRWLVKDVGKNPFPIPELVLRGAQWPPLRVPSLLPPVPRASLPVGSVVPTAGVLRSPASRVMGTYCCRKCR